MRLLGGISVAMARKNFLKEVKGLGTAKAKKEGIFAYSDEWEAGAEMGEGLNEMDNELDGDGDEDEEDEEDEESGNWGYLADGSFADCLEAIMPFLTMELETQEDEHISDDMNVENYFKGKIKKRAQKLEEIKKTCLTNGEYKGRGWQIRSQRSREQCQYMADNGYPIVN